MEATLAVTGEENSLIDQRSHYYMLQSSTPMQRHPMPTTTITHHRMRLKVVATMIRRNHPIPKIMKTQRPTMRLMMANLLGPPPLRRKGK
jgi:hypothetical protein